MIGRAGGNARNAFAPHERGRHGFDQSRSSKNTELKILTRTLTVRARQHSNSEGFEHEEKVNATEYRSDEWSVQSVHEHSDCGVVEHVRSSSATEHKKYLDK